MAVLNPSFEDAGLLPGEAEHWTLVSVASLEAIAGFGADPELAWEGFERWTELWLALDDVPVVRAFFDTAPEGLEDFEETWENDLYLWELPPAQQLPASFGPGDLEDCEGGWANDGYAWSWADVTGANNAGLPVYWVSRYPDPEREKMMRAHPTWSGSDLTGILEALPERAPA